MSELKIRSYDKDLDSSRVSTLWQESFPQYPITPQYLGALLAQPSGTHFVALIENQLIGFCATYKNRSQGEIGYLAVIAIDSKFQQKGCGTKLFEHVKEYMRGTFKTIKAGSSIPRFWPGVPMDLSIKDQEFFVKRGFKEGIKCKDLYQPLSAFKAPQYLVDRAASEGITFAPLTSPGAEECIAAQVSIFPQWAEGYKFLHAQGLHDQIMVAFDQNGTRQIGWTLMLSPTNLGRWDGYAFLTDVCGHGRSGLIAAVGVREDVRGKGVGLGLVCAAVEEMGRQGEIEGIFIDSVVLENFYEKLGFKTWRQYRQFTMEI